MRINLATPFAEKDAAKALGARWDAARKLWYITDVADLTPFARWIADPQAAAQTPAAATTPAAAAAGRARIPQRKAPESTAVVPHCGCDVLPWEDCRHTTGG